MAFIWRQFHKEILQPPFTKISLKIIYLQLNWNLPGADELIPSDSFYHGQPVKINCVVIKKNAEPHYACLGHARLRIIPPNSIKKTHFACVPAPVMIRSNVKNLCFCDHVMFSTSTHLPLVMQVCVLNIVSGNALLPVCTKPLAQYLNPLLSVGP